MVSSIKKKKLGEYIINWVYSDEQKSVWDDEVERVVKPKDVWYVKVRKHWSHHLPIAIVCDVLITGLVLAILSSMKAYETDLLISIILTFIPTIFLLLYVISDYRSDKWVVIGDFSTKKGCENYIEYLEKEGGH